MVKKGKQTLLDVTFTQTLPVLFAITDAGIKYEAPII